MMKKVIYILLLIILNSISFAYSQELTQTIKGKVIDSESQVELPGATVLVVNSNPLIGTVSDVNGRFRLENVPVGRVSLKISFIGYEEQFISGLLVSSGKEISLNISLKESYSTLDEVVIKAETRKEEAINKMATLSARTFSVEDAQRFAGGMDDPSRLASAFAGVTPSTVDNNEIVIRGNAAKGILWKLEGVEIPAPNHLAGMFSGGGVNTMFSSNMLANSDFLTSAFPAEYGNAISGVFDIKMRSGNSDKREYAFQVGSQGIDFAFEGPFVKGKRSTYLINYRYSTIGLLQDLMPQITGLPTYSDLSLKFNFPTKKAGVFSLWSINGMGNIANVLNRDTTEWETNMESFKYNIQYNLTASGINHRIILNKKTYLFSSVSFSATEYVNKNVYYKMNFQEIPVTNQNEINSKISFISFVNHKFNSRHTNRSGIILNRLSYNFDVENNTNVAENDVADFFVNSKGLAYSYQFYTQSKYYLRENLNVNTGIHIVHFSINNELILEPRFGVNWRFMPKHSLSLAYGKHSKIEPLRIYLTEIPVGNNYEELNSTLNVTKAHHFVLGYNVKIGKNTHLRIEPYYQILYDVPVIVDSSVSMINYTSETFFTEQLINTGTGTNIGVDFTLEQFINNGFYYMITSSVYASKYKGGDDIERNTKYNQNFVFNILAGKEWQTKKNNIFGINGKFTVLGGKRQSPVDYQKSNQYKYVIYDDSRIYENQLPTNYYVDISINYTINKPKCSHSIIFQAKNLLMQEESFGHAFNYKTNSVETYGLTIIFPYISYKIQF
ncbi:MAG: TonB-dependent receptor [Bacteroidales bacterium]|nr:TonB-dependent receptor [Bacteroidales bacterium]